MSQPFYRAFEDRYRGSRDTIKARLRAYQPFLQALPRAQALDLGCGRGEWLELLGEQGFRARGVDLDEGMLAACRERGLDVENLDALAALRAQPDGSLVIVSAFHVVEHMPFQVVRDLVAEALRVLQPGGLLIMETPNPENLVVGASDFYMDPSHERPIPPNLLAFATEYAGFTRNKIVRLQEDPQLRAGGRVALGAVLAGASPDYAVVAQKDAPAAPAPIDAFAADYGIDMRELTQRYDQQHADENAEIHRIFARIDQRISDDRASTVAEHLDAQDGIARLGQRLSEAHAGMVAETQALGTAQQAMAQRVEQQGQRFQEFADHTAREALVLVQRVEQQEQRLEELADHTTWQALAQRVEHQEQRLSELATRIEQAQHEAARYAQQVIAMHDSTSWRITAPMRRIMNIVYRLRAAQREGRLGTAFKFRVKRLLRRVGGAVLRRPRLKHFVRTALRQAPALEARLRSLMRDNAPPPPPPVVLQMEHESDELSPRAARVYRQLKQEQARMSNADSH